MGFFIAFASVRLLLLQGTYPIFKPADNPAAFAPDKLSRITTKVYYWFVHYWLLFCPSNLSYDWAFGSIPVIQSLADGRLMSIASFFIFVGLLGFWSLFGLFPEKYRKFSITKTFTKSELFQFFEKKYFIILFSWLFWIYFNTSIVPSVCPVHEFIRYCWFRCCRACYVHSVYWLLHPYCPRTVNRSYQPS